MYNVVKDIFFLISKKERLKFKILIILIFFMSLFEIIGLALILPFLYLVNNLDKATTNPYINVVYTYFNFQDAFSFLCFIGIIAVTFSFIGMLLSIYTNIKLNRYANYIGVDFSIRLLELYAKSDNPEILPTDKKEKRKKILTDTAIIANNIILPSLMIISKIIVVLVLFAGLLFISYSVTLLLFIILLFIYIVIFHLSNTKVKQNLKNIELIKQEKNLMVSDILTDKVTKEEKSKIIKKYFTQAYKLSQYQSFNNTISKLPRYLMMFLVFSFIVFISTFIVYTNHHEIDTLMHKMLLFIVIGLKLLPQIQNIFINYLKLKSNIKSFDNIRETLFKASK